METIGYARVSTAEQSLQLQLDALKCCARVFTDTRSGASVGRRRDGSGLDAALTYLRAGDTLMVWKLDRLGRNVSGLLDLADELRRREINLRSVTEGIDTATPAGRFVFHMLASLAQMERDLIVERTQAGLAAARAQGRVGGRPRVLSDKKAQIARDLFAAGRSNREVSDLLGVSSATLYRLVPVDARQIKLV